MALAKIRFYSNTLGKDTACNVLLPEDRHGETRKRLGERYPVLLLLHGNGDNEDAWISKSLIEIKTRQLPIICVMPDAARGCYSNEVHGLRWFDYFTEELPLVLGNYFPVSPEREDHVVAGVSMGGYGAFRLALSRPDCFVAAASFSGALSLGHASAQGRLSERDDYPSEFITHEYDVFGDEEDIAAGQTNLWQLAQDANDAGVPLPKLFHCCAVDDPLTYDGGKQFVEYVHENCPRILLTYREGEGGHSWNYWNEMLDEVLSFLGLDDMHAKTA